MLKIHSATAVCSIQVQQVFDDMYTAGLQPNIMTYITLLSSYAELGNWQHALQVLNHMCQPQVCSADFGRHRCLQLNSTLDFDLYCIA